MIVAGFGLRGAATIASLRDALSLACDGQIPNVLAAPADRADLVETLAAALRIPFIAVAADILAATETHTRSAVSMAARGTGSVAEAAALAAAGPGARLLVTRHIAPDRMATCALAIRRQEAEA